MAGPFTAFTYGDPALAGFGGTLRSRSSLVGVTPSGNSVPVPVAAVLPPGAIGVAYSETISAQGGTSPYAFSVVSGALPAGLSLNGATGVISGTPTTAAASSFTILVTDARGVTGNEVFSIAVATPTASGANYGFAA